MPIPTDGTACTSSSLAHVRDLRQLRGHDRPIFAREKMGIAADRDVPRDPGYWLNELRTGGFYKPRRLCSNNTRSKCWAASSPIVRRLLRL